MSAPNQQPEQLARDRIDGKLCEAGWVVQDLNAIDRHAAPGVAVREYATDSGPADYTLFVSGELVGVIEAKRAREGHRLSVVEEQTVRYGDAEFRHLGPQSLPFLFEANGEVLYFTDRRDPSPQARELFAFPRPSVLAQAGARSLRTRLREDLPALEARGLRPAQVVAIRNLEASFGESRPRALIQMATGAGKTYTAATFIYRLLKFARAKRILFLVDTRNLGAQARKEFIDYTPQDDNRKLGELYNLSLLQSSAVPEQADVVISTIQRVYAMLKGEELNDGADEESPYESNVLRREPPPVVYNAGVPPDMFDFIVVDECHRSIYNRWRQVLDYFDAFIIGLTATPDVRTYAFFQQNVVSEYSYEESVRDGVNVPFEVYKIETQVTKHGGRIEEGFDVSRRDKLTRAERMVLNEEELDYTGKQLDRDVVNLDQIRTVLRTYKERLPEIMPGRRRADGTYEVPKTLIFAKSDSHAEDIVRTAREVFAERNEFCKKVTYKIDEDPQALINRFRNDYLPRIAVTVDMIATGTDVKALEVLIFMRDVRSAGYFEQMKGRGARSIDADRMRLITPEASAKTHFVIVDAVGATQSKKTYSRPLERQPSIALKELLAAVAVGNTDEDVFLSLAGRLAKLQQQLTPEQRAEVSEKSGGRSMPELIGGLLEAYDKDAVTRQADAMTSEELTTMGADETLTTDERRGLARRLLLRKASTPFTGRLNTFLDDARKVHEQVVDTHTADRVEEAGWQTDADDRNQAAVKDFTDYIAAHRDEIDALTILFGEPYQRRDLTLAMIKELANKLRADRPTLTPRRVWEAYEALGAVEGGPPEHTHIALLSLVRHVCGVDEALTPFGKTVDRRFQTWVMGRQAGVVKYSEDQMWWLLVYPNKRWYVADYE